MSKFNFVVCEIILFMIWFVLIATDDNESNKQAAIRMLVFAVLFMGVGYAALAQW